VTVYFVLALALFYGDSYEEVMRKPVQGLSWLAVWKKEWHVPTASALAQARERLGLSRCASCSSGPPGRARSCLRPARGPAGGG
jgi:hypothetical protein